MEIYKVMSISSAHQLELPYESKCNRMHGHDYKVEVWITGELNDLGMVMDYNHISRVVKRYDHQNLNDLMEEPTTAENFCYRLLSELHQEVRNSEVQHKIRKFRVRVAETPTTYAEQTLELLVNERDRIPKPPVTSNDN